MVGTSVTSALELYKSIEDIRDEQDVEFDLIPRSNDVYDLAFERDGKALRVVQCVIQNDLQFKAMLFATSLRQNKLADLLDMLGLRDEVRLYRKLKLIRQL